MPTPALMTSWMAGALDQVQQGKPEHLDVQVRPENWFSQVDKGMLHFGSRDINPYVPPWHPEGHVCIGWKQYVFGSAVDVSCSQEPQGLIPSNVALCSSTDNGLEDQNSPFHSHLGTYASAQDLTTRSSTENAQVSNAWSSSFVLGGPHVLTGPEGAVPTLGPDKRPRPPGGAGCPRGESSLAEGSAAGLVDEIMPPYLSETDCPAKEVRTSTFEQGTQTMGCRLHWSCTDISSAQLEDSMVSAPDLASLASMHSLSLHLSQLLHSTSELLGSLSQPSVAKKEQNTKRDTLDEAPQALRMDGYTQTTVDEASQTDLASPPLCHQASETKPQEDNVILKVLSSDISTMSQENRDVPGASQKREAEETVWKMAQSPDLQEASTHCRSQSPLRRSARVRFQKDCLGRAFPSVIPPVPDAFLPLISQPEESCCTAVSSFSLGTCRSPGLFPHISESIREPGVQEKLGPTSALLVDRASSPILTLSASTPESGLPPSSLTPSAPSAHPLDCHQKLDSSLDSPPATLEPLMDNYSQTIDESDGSQRANTLGGEGLSERSDRRPFLELCSPCSPQQSLELQVGLVGQLPQHLQPSTAIAVPNRLLPPPPPRRSRRLADSLVPEVISPEHGPLNSMGPSQWQSRTETGGESPVSPVEPQPTPDISSSWGGLPHLSLCPVSELTDTARLRGSALSPPQACQPEGLLRPSSQMCVAPEAQHHGLRDLPVHNKFSNWCGVPDGSPGGLGVTKELGASCDVSLGEQGQSPPQPPEGQSQDLERSQREQIPLQVGAQNCSLSMELTEAKLHHGFGEADALLQVLQSGTGEALAPVEPVLSTWEENCAR